LNEKLEVASPFFGKVDIIEVEAGGFEPELEVGGRNIGIAEDINRIFTIIQSNLVDRV
jgi:hypothetical protein